MVQGSPSRGHTCHAVGCHVEIPPHLFMCRWHWIYLPQQYKNAVRKTYRPGQEKDKRPSKAYFEAARAAIKWVYRFERGERMDDRN